MLMTNCQRQLYQTYSTQKISPTSKFSHQHPQIVINLKSPTTRCQQHHFYPFLPKVKGFKTISDRVAYILCTFTIVNFPAGLHETFFNDIYDWMKFWIVAE